MQRKEKLPFLCEKETMKLKFDKRPKYLGHLALITLVLFPSYYLGNYLLDFAGNYSYIKMFVWFFLTLYLSDSIFESLLKV